MGSKDEKSIVITTLVPTYNQEAFIGDCVQSIVRQQLKPGWHHHIVVGNDGSTDGTKQILESIASTNPHVSITLLNRAPSSRKGRHRWNGRINGRENMRDLMTYKGDFMAFCEGDDLWLEDDKLLQQVSFLQNHPSYNICWSQARLIDEEAATLGQTEIPEELSFEDLRYAFPVGHSSCSTVWRAAGFDWGIYEQTASQGTTNDTMWLNLLLSGKGKVLDSVLVARRIQSEGQWSGENYVLRQAGILTLFNSHGNIFGEDLMPSASLRAALLSQCAHIERLVIDQMSAEELLEECYKKYVLLEGANRRKFWFTRVKNQLRKIVKLTQIET